MNTYHETQLAWPQWPMNNFAPKRVHLDDEQIAQVGALVQMADHLSYQTRCELMEALNQAEYTPIKGSRRTIKTLEPFALLKRNQTNTIIEEKQA